MTKILKRLEESGYVSRAPDPDDGRGSRVLLTDKGRSLQDRVFRAFIASTTSLMAPLSQHQVRAADQSLGDLLELFEHRSTPRGGRV
jgi:DNA-binding MarR family transcriptional regulator